METQRLNQEHNRLNVKLCFEGCWTIFLGIEPDDSIIAKGEFVKAHECVNELIKHMNKIADPRKSEVNNDVHVGFSYNIDYHPRSLLQNEIETDFDSWIDLDVAVYAPYPIGKVVPRRGKAAIRSFANLLNSIFRPYGSVISFKILYLNDGDFGDMLMDELTPAKGEHCPATKAIAAELESKPLSQAGLTREDVVNFLDAADDVIDDAMSCAEAVTAHPLFKRLATRFSAALKGGN